jgi:hypothetical protein
MVWLSDAAGWMFAAGGPANDYAMPLQEGFNVVIPEGAGAQRLVVVGRVPTNTTAAGGQVQVLQGGGIYNVVSYNLPYRVTLADCGLREAGFSGAPAGEPVNPNNSDELRILTRSAGSMGSPKARILMDADGQFVFWSGGPFLASAEHYRLQVDDALIVYTVMSESDLVWTQSLPYPVPTKNISP